MLIRRLQFMKEDYKEDLTIYQQQLSQVLQSLAPSFQNPRYTHARDPNERNKKLLKKVSQVISGYLTRFGKSYVHLVFLLQKFFSMGAPTNSGARGPPTAKSGPGWLGSPVLVQPARAIEITSNRLVSAGPGHHYLWGPHGEKCLKQKH